MKLLSTRQRTNIIGLIIVLFATACGAADGTGAVGKTTDVPYNPTGCKHGLVCDRGGEAMGAENPTGESKADDADKLVPTK